MPGIVANYVASRDAAKGDELSGSDTKISYTKPKTIFHAIDKSALAASEKTPLRMKQDGLAVLFAGSETIARVLSHTMYHLLANPEILQEVRIEISAAVGNSNGLPDVKILEGLPWLTAVVRESLRLRATVTSRLPLFSDKELAYGDWIILAGTAVSMSTRDILHDEAIYPEPMAFKPQRWFQATEQQNRCFVAFSKGTRVCPGSDFAHVEMYLVLAMLLPRFELELFDTYRERDVDYIRDCFLGGCEPSSRGIRVRVVADKKTAH